MSVRTKLSFLGVVLAALLWGGGVVAGQIRAPVAELDRTDDAARPLCCALARRPDCCTVAIRCLPGDTCCTCGSPCRPG